LSEPLSEIYTKRFGALGTYVDLACSKCDESESILDGLLDLLEQLDEAASCYRADSEVRVLYERSILGGEESVFEVSDVLWDLLISAREAVQVTRGLVDIGCGGLFWEDYDIAGGELVQIDGEVDLIPSERAVRIRRGTLIDLGSVGKAYWAQRCASSLAVEFGCDILVGLGGDIYAKCDQGTKFPVAVPMDGRSVYEPGDEIVELSSMAIATSARRTREHRYSALGKATHIFDPRTLQPAISGAQVATVMGRVASVCNSLSLMSVVDLELAKDAIFTLGYMARLVTETKIEYVGGFEDEVLSQ